MMRSYLPEKHPNLFRLLIALATILNASTALSYSLQEALQTAFQLNQQTAAIGFRQQAAEDRATSAWARILPQISLYASNNRNRFGQTVGNDFTIGSSQNTGYEYGLSVNLFRGGADYFSAKAFDSAAKAQAAIFNSTNALIPNTKGAIANLVAAAFLNILAQNSALEALALAESRLLKIKTVTKDSQNLGEIERNLLGIRAMTTKTKNEKRQAEREYTYGVTLPPPPDLASFEEVISSLIIPSDFPEALQIASSTSPELIASRYLLEEAKYRREAEAGRLLYPSVDFTINRGADRSYNSGLLDSRITVTTFLLSGTWVINFSTPSDLSSMKNHVAAVNADLNSEVEKLKYQLDSIYETWKDSEALLEQYNRNLEMTDASADQLMKDIDQGKPIDFILAIKLLNDRNQTFSNVLQLKIQVAFTKFQIQKLIGTLFQATQIMYNIQIQGKGLQK